MLKWLKKKRTVDFIDAELEDLSDDDGDNDGGNDDSKNV